jgi:hypothetical protein
VIRFFSQNQSEKKTKYYPHVKQFLEDFANIVWFTYRKDFPCLHHGGYCVTSDFGMIETWTRTHNQTYNTKIHSFICLIHCFLFVCEGWGCMLRTGQMILAECLMVLYFGRGTSNHQMNTVTHSIELIQVSLINSGLRTTEQ